MYYKNQNPKEMDGINSTKESHLCLTRSQILSNRVKSIENQGYEPPWIKQEMRMENVHKRKRKDQINFLTRVSSPVLDLPQNLEH